MTWAIPTAVRNSLADQYDSLVSTGAGTATVTIRTGAAPGPNAAASGTLLATFSLQNPAFGAAATGVITLQGVPISATAAATGTAGHCRIHDRDGTVVGEGTVTATGGGGDVELASTSISAGVTVRITSGTVTMPAGG